jgi:biopolymer transport protein ExbD
MAVVLWIAFAGMADAQTAKTIEILSNEHVRIDGGPELDRTQFQAEIKRIAALRPRPAISIKLPQTPNVRAIAHFMQDMQAAGFKIGFVTRPAQP